MSNIAQFRIKILTKLNDPNGDRFSDDQLDSALRDALQEYDTMRPYALVGDILANGERDLPVTTITDDITLIFRAIWHDGSQEGDNLAFYATKQDDIWHLELNKDVPSGDTIALHYTRPHTIEDLDSATETTVWDEDLLSIGAAGFALLARSVLLAEENNLNTGTSKRLEDSGNKKLSIFRAQFSEKSGSGFATWS
ncbi:MAG: hypothetical protein DRP85_09375 [Candidatus Makaraimicrobium thalassicum]|nr:MAG: hypothetical protein DRP85_09375 [Candidatus Omnitrophota bacterium]